MITPERYVGSFLTVTGPDKNQCTAVAHVFEQDNGLPIVFGDAKDTYANAPRDYDRLPYTKGVIAPANSVVVWNGTWGGGNGHTAFVLRSDANGFDAVSQNDPTGSKVIIKHYAYSDAITGFFYPKGGSMAEVFNEGDRSNLNVYLYGSDIGRFKGAVGREWKDAMYFGVFETPEYKTDALVNPGDVTAVNDVYGADDGKVNVGHDWKWLFYNYATKHKASIPAAVQAFVDAFKVLSK